MSQNEFDDEFAALLGDEGMVSPPSSQMQLDHLPRMLQGYQPGNQHHPPAASILQPAGTCTFGSTIVAHVAHAAHDASILHPAVACTSCWCDCSNLLAALQAEVDAMVTDDPKAAITADAAVKVNNMPAPAIQEAKQVQLVHLNQPAARQRCFSTHT
jgi:hypothetical protein